MKDVRSRIAALEKQLDRSMSQPPAALDLTGLSDDELLELERLMKASDTFDGLPADGQSRFTELMSKTEAI